MLGGPRSGHNDLAEMRAHSADLFSQLRADDVSEAERARLRDELVRLHLPLVEHFARRFLNRGEPFDDLLQVGTIGLIKAIDRFDTERGVEFSTYATPTIVGEIKRHFRDRGWAIRVPRRLQELRLAITTATAELTQEHGRSPTVSELARVIGVSDEEMLEGLESSNAYSTLSLDAPDSSEDSALSMIDVIGSDDVALEHVEDRETIKPLLEALDPREKHILTLRFFRGMTQSQIAAEIGISQMHVSRLLARTLQRLRDDLAAEDGVRRPAERPQAPRGAASSPAGPVGPSSGSARAASEAGWKIPATTSTATTARTTAATVPSPPRKLQATPSWISCASTTGARAHDSRRSSARQQNASPPAYTTKKTEVVTPIVARAPLSAVSSSTPRTTRRTASRPTSETATSSGTGARPARGGCAAGTGDGSEVVTGADRTSHRRP